MEIVQRTEHDFYVNNIVIESEYLPLITNENVLTNKETAVEQLPLDNYTLFKGMNLFWTKFQSQNVI